MKRVLHFITGLEKGGGAEAMLLKTLPHLQRTENAVCVVKGKGEIGKKLEQKGVKVYYLDMKSYFDIGVISRYKKVIKEYEPDVQVNYLIHADIFGRIFANRAGVKKVISYIRNRHTNFTYSFLDKLTLKKVDFLLANSEANLDFYRKKYNFPKDESKCIPNGIQTDKEVDKDYLQKLKEELSIKDNDFVITCVARLHKQKNIDTLIKAGNILKEKAGDFKILICGQGEEKENLEKLIKNFGLQDRVFLLGNRDNIWEILSLSHIFVLPSSKEGMSNALLEAMAAGLLSVVSNIEENKELIQDDQTGYTFRTGDYHDLVKKITKIKENKQEKERIKSNAKKKVKESYDINKIIKELDAFLEDLS